MFVFALFFVSRYSNPKTIHGNINIYKDNETKTKENQNETKEIIKNEAANKKLGERQPIEIREKTSPLLFKFKLKQCFFFMILQIFVKCIQFDGDKAIQFIIIIIRN